MSRRGFSLIELLVVIAIIAIIAALLYPILITAKETTKIKTCSNNLRHLGQAFKMYCDDYQGYAPSDGVWCRQLLPYTGAGKIKTGQNSSNVSSIYICPGDKRGVRKTLISDDPEVSTEPAWLADGKENGDYTSYARVFPATRPEGDENRKPARPEMWAKPSRDALFGDKNPNFHFGMREETEKNNIAQKTYKGDALRRKCVAICLLDGSVKVGTVRDRLQWYPGAWRNALVYDNPYNMDAAFDKLHYSVPPNHPEAYNPSLGKDL